jgi:hypothetical protein
MRKVLTALAVLAIAWSTAWAQTIKPDRDQIVHVQTALNHLTVIEVGEPVTMVEAGSEAFKVEGRETKVLVRPDRAQCGHELVYLDGLKTAHLRA